MPDDFTFPQSTGGKGETNLKENESVDSSYRTETNRGREVGGAGV